METQIILLNENSVKFMHQKVLSVLRVLIQI